MLLLASRLSEITKEHFHLQGKQIILSSSGFFDTLNGFVRKSDERYVALEI